MTRLTKGLQPEIWTELRKPIKNGEAPMLGRQCGKHPHYPEGARRGGRCGAGAVGRTSCLRGTWLLPGAQ